MIISYAQNREDIILNGFFKESETGFYVDVGANHPVHESVTKLFYKKGWRGINVEPTEWLHRLLVIDRPKDINVQLGVSDKAGKTRFREYLNGDGLSTFSPEMQKEYEANKYYFAQDYKEYEVEIVTLAHIFKMHKVTTIDFMKVDIEGYEYEALSGNDWQKYRPKVLCIEANHIIKDWHKLIKDAGYKLAFFDGLNEYFVSEEESQRLKEFSYPDKVLLGPKYISRSEYLVRQDYDREKALLEYRLEVQTKQLEELSGQPAPMQSQNTTARVRRGIQRIDAKLENALQSGRDDTSAALSDTSEDGVHSLDDFAEQLKEQLTKTLPRKQGSKRIAHKSYRKSKQVAKQVMRKGFKK